MSKKIIPLRPEGSGQALIRQPLSFLDKQDIEKLELISNCLKILFGFMNGAQSAFDYANQESQLPLSHIPGLIVELDNILKIKGAPAKVDGHTEAPN